MTITETGSARRRDDQVEMICQALVAHHGGNSLAFADRQMGAAIGKSLEIWLSVMQRLRM